MNAEYSPHQHPLFFRGGGEGSWLLEYVCWVYALVGWLDMEMEGKWKGNADRNANRNVNVNVKCHVLCFFILHMNFHSRLE